MSDSLFFESGWDFENCQIEGEKPLLIKNVLLRGKESKNGYSFAEGCCEASIYEKAHVFLDHGHGQRSVKDLAGWVVNPRLENGVPRGDIQLMDSPAGAVFRQYAESKPPKVGLSHVALCRLNKAGTVVEEVTRILSVDLVLNPATTKSLTETTRNPEMDEQVKALYESQIADLKAKNTELETKLKTSEEGLKALNEKHTAVSLENDALKLANDGFKANEAAIQARTEAEEAIKASGLDLTNKAVCSDLFVEAVANADAEARKSLIADRVSLVGEAAKGKQVGSAGRKPASEAFDPNTALQSLLG